MQSLQRPLAPGVHRVFFLLFFVVVGIGTLYSAAADAAREDTFF